MHTLISSPLQGFTTYRLQNFFEELEPVYIPKGDFFIGWQQVSDETEDAIPIGYDLNSPLGFDNTFQNLGGGWGPLASFIPKGSLMIRPVLGEEAAMANSESAKL